MKQIKLTDWFTGESVYVERDEIVVCRQLEASVHEYGKCPTELGARTRIDTRMDTFLVRETPDEIFEGVTAK